LKNPQAVGVAQHGVRGAFGVGHEAEHVAGSVADAGDVIERPVGVGRIGDLPCRIAIAEKHLALGIEFLQHGGLGIKTAFAVGDGDFQGPAHTKLRGDQAFIGLGPDVHVLAGEQVAAVVEQGAGKQVRLGEDLEAVADAQYQAAAVGELDDLLHDG